MNKLEKKFDELIATGIFDDNEYQEYEISIIEFDNKQKGEEFFPYPQQKSEELSK